MGTREYGAENDTDPPNDDVRDAKEWISTSHDCAGGDNNGFRSSVFFDGEIYRTTN